MKFKPLSILLLIALVLSLDSHVSSARPAALQTTHAKWTIMVYLAADNNLEPNSIINLMEMAAIGSAKDVNIVVQITRPPGYNGFYGEWGGTRRFLVTRSDGGLSAGDFQISPSRFAAYLAAIAPDYGLSQDQVSQITKSAPAQQEQAALQLSVPAIETQTPLTPLQLKDLQDLGAQVNSADGATLTDFGTWAVKNYPADHYGLIMWDHGGGWSMIASDDTLGPAGIPMPAFKQALDTITKASGQKFDFIGFDACLMSQLPVAVTIQPYANYEIAAEELVPGFGWDYTPPLKALVANPALSVTDFGKAEVDAFNTLYTGTEKRAAQSFDLGVTDLSKVDGVVKSLADFNTAVKAATDDELKAIATARSNVQLFGSVGESPDATASIASVDLSDFMRLMSDLSGDSGVKQAAKHVMQAVSQMVVYHKASASLPHANGLSIFFPQDANTFSAADGQRYRTEFADALPSWQDFLDTFYGVANGAATSNKLVLQVTKVSTDQQPGSIHDTPVISYSLNGKNIVGVTAYVIYQINPQTSVVLDTFPITSNVTTADGSQVNDYPDGQTSNDFYWNTKIPKLSDGANSLLVLMTTNANDQQHGFIRGLYTDKVTGTQTDSSLLIDLDTYQSSGLWASQDPTKPDHTIAQITPKPGDTFEPIYRVLDKTNGAQDTLSGTKLTFGKTPFQVTDAPGPDGKYTVLLLATDAAGNTIADSATVNVQNSGLDATLQGFKDLGFGVSFLYPWTWTDVQTFQRQDGTDELYVTDESGALVLSALNFPGLTSLQEVVGKAQSEINAINGVKVGQTADVQVGKYQGTSISYQFTDDSGTQIDGTAVAVYVSDTKSSYVFLLEAPDNQADTAAKVLDQVLKSIQFFAPAQ
ncbi:MAG: clostripain-related cysteine peptidase [Aggregatilineales bacterium]